jgi:hypothetical protein
MDGVILIEKFVNLIENNKKVSTKLFKNIVNSEDIPNSIKTKAKKAYIKTGGGALDYNELLTEYTCKLGHIKKPCGSFGCVFGYYPQCQQLRNGKCSLECPKTGIEGVDTVVKMIKGNDKKDIKFSVEKFIRICDEKFGDVFINDFTSFKKINKDGKYIYYNDNPDYFCYFLKICDGDINKLLKLDLDKDVYNIDKNLNDDINRYVLKIIKKISETNMLGFIHGDIKFDNLLYKTYSKYGNNNVKNRFNNEEIITDIYIHDFDSVLYFNGKIDINEPFPMITPYCACPIYVFFRQFIKTRKSIDIVVRSSQVEDFMNYLIKENFFDRFNLFINGVIGAYVGGKNLFEYLCVKRNNVCGHMINIFLHNKMDKKYIEQDEIMDEINEKIKELEKLCSISRIPHFNYLVYIYIIYLLYGEGGIRLLIQYSDIYSLSMELFFKYYVTENPLFLKLGYEYLTKYFYLPIQSIQSGGRGININDIIDSNYDNDKKIIGDIGDYRNYRDDIGDYRNEGYKINGTCRVRFTNTYKDNDDFGIILEPIE